MRQQSLHENWLPKMECNLTVYVHPVSDKSSYLSDSESQKMKCILFIVPFIHCQNAYCEWVCTCGWINYCWCCVFLTWRSTRQSCRRENHFSLELRGRMTRHMFSKKCFVCQKSTDDVTDRLTRRLPTLSTYFCTWIHLNFSSRPLFS